MKVFFVEDEYVVREGIKRNVDWAANGYEFCGEAGDGELAYPMIQKAKPDIVITDIRMPFMDGLALSRLIKKEMPWIEIIILTGFEEFEYAKEALRIGVAEFLTKPISGEDLLREMNVVAQKILEKRELEEKLNKEQEENLQQDRKNFFQQLVTGGKSTEELLSMAEKLELDITAMCYNMVLFDVTMKDSQGESDTDAFQDFDREIAQLDGAYPILAFDRSLEGVALLFKADSVEELEKYQKDYLDQVRKIGENYPNIRYFGGIGEPVLRLREIPQSFEKASHAFAHRYLVSGSAFLDCRELGQESLSKTDDFVISSVSPKQVDRSRIQEFLKVGTREDVSYFAEEYFEMLGNGALQSNIFRQYIVMDIYFCVAEFVEGMQYDKDNVQPPELSSGQFMSKEGVMEYAVNIMEKAIELREQVVQDRYGDVVSRVIAYIEENYADEDLTLNDVAMHVNFSSNHLSMVFSQQTGQTFIHYLTDYRMNKARELLRGSVKRSSEIGLEVGYKDPHYFSYLFKKMHGVTPTQYRGNKTEKDA